MVRKLPTTVQEWIAEKILRAVTALGDTVTRAEHGDGVSIRQNPVSRHGACSNCGENGPSSVETVHVPRGLNASDEEEDHNLRMSSVCAGWFYTLLFGQPFAGCVQDVASREMFQALRRLHHLLKSFESMSGPRRSRLRISRVFTSSDRVNR